MNPLDLVHSPVDIAHLIQVALTPIFLISAIGVTLNVLTNRLARIVDRARALENRAHEAPRPDGGGGLHGKLAVLERRARWIYSAITLITLSALVKLCNQALAARRVRLDTSALPPDCVFPPPVGRVVLNLIVLACDCLPRGGTIVLLGEPADLLVRIAGPGAAWPPGFTDCMRDEAAALAALTSALSVQMPLTALFAQSGGLRLSPVLGPASGIEALRLSSG